MRKLTVIVALLAACAMLFVACAPASAVLGPAALADSVSAGATAEVKTKSGPVKGVQADGLRIFKGIPYADPPERFAPPEEVTSWTKTLDCTEFGPTAMQVQPREGMEMSEDCLTLNIWTPAKSATEKLPVYVWIHGGGFAQGAGSEASYDGTNFAKDGIVYISINYRLNALGFLASQETYDQYGTTGNWGILDQIIALEWIQKNVSAFGGDPKQVTVGGESAGSYAVSMLVQSPLAEGLFRRAIMESGSMLGTPGNSQYARGNLQRSIEMGAQMAFTFGAADDEEGLEALRAADAEVFVQMSPLNPDFTEIPGFMMIPVLDGYVLPEDIYGGVKAGELNDVDVLWGFNKDEGTVFIPEDRTEEQYQALAAKMFGYDNAAAVLERFPVDDEHDATARCREILTYGMFSAVMKPYGDALAGNGNAVYAYCYNYVSAAAQKAGLGAHHGSEIAYVFGNLPADASAADKTLSAEMHARWVNFIKTGDPNDGDLPSDTEWPEYDGKNNDVMLFDKTLSTEELPGLADIEFMEDVMFGEDGYYFGV